MGVWQHSPTARILALQNSSLRREYDRLLPGWTENDIAASPYAIYDYSLDSEFGNNTELSLLKTKLNNNGLNLILDFVPNHVAVNHRWITLHPEWFIPGSSKDVKAHPDWFFSPDGTSYLAHGRDPNFPPWTDTAQLNYYSADLRQTLIQELLKIAAVADGVRCDMAMLVINNIFQMVWGDIAAEKMPQTEFWAQAISEVKKGFPDFIFIAEAYWGRELQLLEQGFNFIYDKALYDKLRYASSTEILTYVVNKGADLARSVHFIENHDEPRICSLFGKEKSKAAAVAMATMPGIRLFFDGQLQGKCIHTPIQLVTEIAEPGDVDIAAFYKRLLYICGQPAFREGTWMPLNLTEASQNNNSYLNLMSWCWRNDRGLKVVIINYSPDSSQGRLLLPPLPGEMSRLITRDELTDAVYESDADEVNSLGLYIALQPWQSHILDVVLTI